MSRALVDIVLLELFSQPTGHVTLDTAISGTLGKSKASTKAKTINKRRRAIGTLRGTPDFTIDLECYEEKGGNQVDWDFLWDNDTEIAITYELADGGLRRTVSGCTVDDVSRATSENGDSKLSIKIAGIDDNPDQ